MSELPKILAQAYFYDANGLWRGPGIDDAVRWNAVADVVEAQMAAAVTQERERCSHLAWCAISLAKDADWDAAERALNRIDNATPTEPKP